MSLEIGVNSYLTLEEAQSIVDNELYSDSSEFQLWCSLNEREREIICKRGTTAINSLEFIGQRRVYNTKLKWPRVINCVEDTPYEIKYGALLNGLLDKITVSSDNYKLINSGVKSMTVGPNSVSLESNKFTGINGVRVYDDVKNIISRYLLRSVYN